MMLSTISTIVRRSWLLDGVRSLSLTNTRCSNQNSDGDDKNKAKQKLNALLETIIKDESLVNDDRPKQEAAPRPKIREKKAKERTERNLGEKMVNAAKEVAMKIEGDQSKTEAELLGKVVARDETLQKSVFKASGKSTLNLLLAELEVEESKSKHKRHRSTLESLRERGERKGGFSRDDMMRSGGRRPQQRWTGATIRGEAVDIFGGRPLGIFKPKENYESGPKLDTWDQCSTRELKLAFTHPPRNIWEQMIQWTDKEMLWKFPIDNEQGLEKEQEVSFVDHIFLDVHLEDWCPKRGPIRNYMDLVCVGLSRNHWLSVEEKKDHIMWYKEYFLSKKELIKELGAGEFVESEEISANP